MLAIRGCGLSSAFGPTRADALSAIGDDRSAWFSNPSHIDASFNKQVCAFRDREGVGRFEDRALALAREAVTDLLTSLSLRDGEPSWDMALVMPEVDDDLPADRIERTARAIIDEIGRIVSDAGSSGIGRIAVRPYGHAGVGWCLADRLYRAPDPPSPLLLIAVDSYSDRARLRLLGEADRLFSDRTPYGLVPGEMGGALLLADDADATGEGMIAAAAATREPVPEHVEDETLFVALSDAVLGVAEAANARIDAWFTDWNNSRYRASELSYGLIRASEFLPPDLEPCHPALVFGDVGAASGVAPIALAGALRPASSTSVSTAGSFGGLRAAFVHARGDFTRHEQPSIDA